MRQLLLVDEVAGLPNRQPAQWLSQHELSRLREVSGNQRCPCGDRRNQSMGHTIHIHLKARRMTVPEYCRWSELHQICHLFLIIIVSAGVGFCFSEMRRTDAPTTKSAAEPT